VYLQFYEYKYIEEYFINKVGTYCTLVNSLPTQEEGPSRGKGETRVLEVVFIEVCISIQ
jgi:hypothetical protein